MTKMSDEIELTKEMIDGYYESCERLNSAFPSLRTFTDTSERLVKELLKQKQSRNEEVEKLKAEYEERINFQVKANDTLLIACKSKDIELQRLHSIIERANNVDALDIYIEYDSMKAILSEAKGDGK